MKNQTAMERFMAKVVKTDSCWLWQGARDKDNYGLWTPDARRSADRKCWRAHRWAYDQFVGPIPEGMTIDHLCRVKNCVNPAHLEPCSIAENIRRRPPKKACPVGHPLDEENLYIWENQRLCKACRAVRMASYYQQRKAV